MKYLVDREEKIPVTVYFRVNLSSSRLETVSDQEIQKLKESNEGKLPTNIFEEIAWWAPETWEVATWIEENATTTDPITKERSISMKKYMELRIQALLKDWTLKKNDPRLELRTNMVPGTAIQALTPDVMSMIKQIDRTVIESLYIKALQTGRSDPKVLKNEH